MKAKGVLDYLQDTARAVEREVDAARDRAIRVAGDATGRTLSNQDDLMLQK
ncbi:hypothetical protein D3C72_2243290 [compost metagenome]